MEAHREVEKGVRSHGRWAGPGQAVKTHIWVFGKDLFGKGQEIALEVP